MWRQSKVPEISSQCEVIMTVKGFRASLKQADRWLARIVCTYDSDMTASGWAFSGETLYLLHNF
jgi:hypothetical protein